MTAPRQPDRRITRGSGGDGVKWLQWWLNLWGYKLYPDGEYGAKTENAVRDVRP